MLCTGMRTVRASARSTVILLAWVAGCGGGGGPAADGGPDGAPDAAADASAPDGEVAPIFRNPVGLDDNTLATQALTLLGAPALGAPENCNACHSLTRQEIRWWRALSDTSMTTCLTDLSVPTQEVAIATIDCLRAKAGAPFQARKLGIYTTAAHLDWFQFLFRRGFPTGWEALHTDFKDRVLMPKGTHPPFTQMEFDIVAEWFVRGVPLLDDLLPEDPPPTTCTDGVSGDVAVHAGEMATSGWGAVNAENGILMYGCAGALTPLDCLSAYPEASTFPFGTGWAVVPGSKLRILRQYGYDSAYWTRSSADGRFIGHGSYTSGVDARIIDLLEDRVIPTDAFYDPAFFPDNSGFVFQHLDAHICPTSVLTSSPLMLTLDEPGCTTVATVGLYEHVGAALGGGDYWTINGDFVSDDGGHDATLGNPNAWFDGASDQKLVRLVNSGSGLTAAWQVMVDTPFEADAVLSPSARLMVTRVAGPGGSQLGFVLRRIDMTPIPGGFDVTVPEIARYCLAGGKPGFSYDERYMVIHQYVTSGNALELGYTGPGDPAFTPYLSQGAANVYLIDLVTGTRTRLTNMAPGQYALFPHFRSDGWIYWIVRQPSGTGEIAVASDAALVIAGP